MLLKKYQVRDKKRPDLKKIKWTDKPHGDLPKTQIIREKLQTKTEPITLRKIIWAYTNYKLDQYPDSYLFVSPHFLSYRTADKLGQYPEKLSYKNDRKKQLANTEMEAHAIIVMNKEYWWTLTIVAARCCRRCVFCAKGKDEGDTKTYISLNPRFCFYPQMTGMPTEIIHALPRRGVKIVNEFRGEINCWTVNQMLLFFDPLKYHS